MKTAQDLFDAIARLQGDSEAKDTSQYRYVIYARKSSESEERQVRSLGDQVIECENLADNKGYKLLNRPLSPIEEKQSAKEPDIRPKFKKMLDGVKEGKFDGIIAWHPDRLARNMKDAGEIIDLLDKGIIKDLQFVSFTFENSTAGKMLLGISFVLSKQYSDKLSDDVKRGQRRSIEEGRYLSKAKHGYYKDINQRLWPDKDNFSILQKGWYMRLEGKTQEEIAQYMNSQGYERSEGVGGTSHKPFKMSNKVLSDVFRDPFYAGVLVYGQTQKTMVKLEDVYPDFTPMVTPEEFSQVNRLSDISKAFKMLRRGAKSDVKADFLRRIVYCGHCGHQMSTGVTPKMNKNKGLTNYFNFRCDTKGCKIKVNGRKVNQNVRGNVVLDFVYEFLEKNKFADKKAYNSYVREMKSVQANELKELENKRKSLQQVAKELEDRIIKLKDFILEETDSEIKATYKEDLKVKNAELKIVLNEIEEIKVLKAKGGKAILTYQEFIELFNDLPAILRKTKPMEGKDKLIRKIFSNFTLKNKKVASYQLNQPFKDFIEKGKIVNSRGGGN